MTKDKFDFTPFGGWVILPNPSKRKTDAGIILDDATAKQLAVGPDCRQTKIGDTVMVDPNSEAMLIHINDVQYLFVNEFQILGKF